LKNWCKIIGTKEFICNLTALSLPKSILLSPQPSLPSSGKATTKISKSPFMIITAQVIIGLHALPPPSKVVSSLSENGTTVLVHDTPTLICRLSFQLLSFFNSGKNKCL